MFEYKFLHLTRDDIETTVESVNKKGKIKRKASLEEESMEDFLARAEQVTNNLAKDGWEIISINYSVPIDGETGPGGAGYIESDQNSAEFVIVLKRKI